MIEPLSIQIDSQLFFLGFNRDFERETLYYRHYTNGEVRVTIRYEFPDTYHVSFNNVGWGRPHNWKPVTTVRDMIRQYRKFQLDCRVESVHER